MTEKSPAMPFYGKQFYDDESVWLSSLAHQGLYVALLWHEWANGSIPDDVSLIARLIGQRESDVRKLWDDVARYFVPCEDAPGRLINRPLEEIRADMVRLREKRSAAGSKGGSITQAKVRTGVEANVQAKINPPYGDGEATVLLQPGDLFDELWNLYPRKMGKHDAQRHFFAQVKTRADGEAIRAALVNFKRELELLGTDPKFIPHGSTWFNNRWRDYVPGVWNPPQPPKPPSLATRYTPAPEKPE